MSSIIRSSLYKLIKDWTFRITLIIGLAVAAIHLLVFEFDPEETLAGQSLLTFCSSPASNFGITVPINLIIFIVSEFTLGTLRNKIIAGHTKFKLYVVLFLIGLIFTFSLMIVYLGIVVGISSAIGGFDIKALGGASGLCFFLLYTTLTYIFVTTFSVFFATLFRSVGGSISIIVTFLVIVGLLPVFMLALSSTYNPETPLIWISPLYVQGMYAFGLANIGKQTSNIIAAGIVTPLYWTIVLFVTGGIIFANRDIK